MNNYTIETVISVRHWNESLFSFRVTRSPSLRFINGQFIMIGLLLPDSDKPLLRAYSIASANHDEYLEFLSIKVENGSLTSKLKNVRVGDRILVSKKPTGSLVIRDLKPGKNLYLLATGTGLAPFISLIQDPEVYEKFKKVILVHGVRYIDDLAYYDFIKYDLPEHEFFSDVIKNKLIYYPTVTREKFKNVGRITDIIQSGELFNRLHLPYLDYNNDRVMICGSPSVLKDCCKLLDSRGFKVSPHIGAQGDYVIERSFVEK